MAPETWRVSGERRWRVSGEGAPGSRTPSHAMASVVVKTIWQSKEIHEAGDPPAGVESHSQLVPEASGGVTSPAKGTVKKKKAVSFHGWVYCTPAGAGLAPSAASNRAQVPPWALQEVWGAERASKGDGKGKTELRRERGRR